MMRGFSLIEVMLALAIGSILSGIMYMCLFQSQRVANSIENITNIQMRALIARRQLVRDISGAFIPTHILEPKKEQKKESGAQQSNAKKENGTKKEEPKAKDEQGEKDKNIKEVLGKAFDGTADDTQFKQLLFITNNPLEIYWSNKAGRPKFRAEKVTYTLEQEKKDVIPSYRLMRTTTYPKGGKEKEVTQTYELVSGIKKMTLQYIAVIEEQETEEKKSDAKNSSGQKDNPAQEKQEKKEKKKEVKTFNDWAVRAMKDDDVRLQKKLPDFITITLELWNSTKTKAETFTFTVPIAWQEIKHKPKPQAQQPIKGARPTPGANTQQQPQQPQGPQKPQQMQRR